MHVHLSGQGRRGPRWGGGQPAHPQPGHLRIFCALSRKASHGGEGCVCADMHKKLETAQKIQRGSSPRNSLDSRASGSCAVCNFFLEFQSHFDVSHLGVGLLSPVCLRGPPPEESHAPRRRGSIQGAESPCGIHCGHQTCGPQSPCPPSPEPRV